MSVTNSLFAKRELGLCENGTWTDFRWEHIDKEWSTNKRL